MMELMTTCLSIEDYCEHEKSIFRSDPAKAQIYCSKHPSEMPYMPALLRFNRALWVVYMLRDPRDVIVSRHRQEPSRYWSNLRVWNLYHDYSLKVLNHPRCLRVRYEDLVGDPDAVQNQILQRMHFLRKTRKFSEFHKYASPSDAADRALSGLRPINSTSIGRWRQHKGRIVSQLRIHGPISSKLIDMGYEKDTAWLEELAGVEEIDISSKEKDQVSLLFRMKFKYRIFRKVLVYVIQQWARGIRGAFICY